MPVINVADKLARFDEHWAPRTVAKSRSTTAT
jgi:hypothetical protein